jgi:pyruvate carboxylase
VFILLYDRNFKLFSGESGDFAKACLENGIKFVGPSPDVMYRMGNKTAARKAAIEAGSYLISIINNLINDLKQFSLCRLKNYTRYQLSHN